MKQLYDTPNKLAGKCSRPERAVKDEKDKPITEIQEQRNRWVEHFEELLNRPGSLNPSDIEAEHTNLPIDVTPPTVEHIKKSTRQTRSGESTTPDNISPEALKSHIEVTAHMLHTIFRYILEE
ncbi:unnamed protein product [Schistosoma mattheei]|uniref:Uncharacterized protein n=1 Tax=Schistosoma mattheei TaxID=31246 RepID=A0A183NJ63_9TREM|nr:unnamed protein product [Schistosoma mattheei]